MIKYARINTRYYRWPFQKAREIMLSLNFQQCHEEIIVRVCDSQNRAFLNFYEYLVHQSSDNAKLHYVIAAMLTTVFNVLLDGYERASKHALKAIDLAGDDLSLPPKGGQGVNISIS
jgi:hypothetical protein